MVHISSQVTNTNKDTTLKWFKDGKQVTDIVYEQSTGVSTLTIQQVPAMIPLCFIFRIIDVGEGLGAQKKYESAFRKGSRSIREVTSLIFIGLKDYLTVFSCPS